MNITKENDELVIRIPFTQKGEFTYGEGMWSHDNLLGIIVKGKEREEPEMYISRAIYLDYKDDLQEGMPLVHFYGDQDDFLVLCEKLGIQVWHHDRCIKCKEVIYGTRSWTEAGHVCMGCVED